LRGSSDWDCYSDHAQQIANQLIASGGSSSFGIQMATLTFDIKETLNRDSDGGVQASRALSLSSCWHPRHRELGYKQGM